jgi:dihydroflavonol-4-reductase
MAGTDAVVHLAGAYEFWLDDRREFRRVNVEGTRNVMECALEARVAKAVLVSTFGVWGRTGPQPVTEETPFGPERSNDYFETKYQGELVARELARTRNLPLVVVYPAGVLGAGDPKPSGAFLGHLAHGKLPAVPFRNSPFSWVHVDDVAEAIVRALEKPGNVGEGYIACAESLTFGELAKEATEAAGTRVPRLPMPGWMAMGGAHLLTALSRLTHRPPPLGMSVDQMRTMRAGGRADGSKAERELGIHYRPIREAVREFVAALPK